MRRLQALSLIRSSLRAGHAVARAFDITKEAQYEQLIDFTVKEFGGMGVASTKSEELTEV
jgi:hypothetical protein